MTSLDTEGVLSWNLPSQLTLELSRTPVSQPHLFPHKGRQSPQEHKKIQNGGWAESGTEAEKFLKEKLDEREGKREEAVPPTGKVHFSRIITKKFRGCSRHGKSLSVFKSHFLSQTFALFPVTKRKEAATHEVSGMHPREPQLSLGEASVWL